MSKPRNPPTRHALCRASIVVAAAAPLNLAPIVRYCPEPGPRGFDFSRLNLNATHESVRAEIDELTACGLTL